MSDPIITEKLQKRYRKLEALHGLDLRVPEGSVYALVGPNGAGKTTAILTMLNLQEPNSGRAELLGVDSRRLRPADMERIGYVSENQQLPGWMTVARFLDYLKGFYRTWDNALEAELLRSVDLPRDRTIRALSRGMRMKAALVSSLAYRPKLLILDEPFSGLDAAVRDDLIAILLRGAEECTVFISSHDLAEIESFSSHIGYLEAGTLRFSEEMTALAARFREVEVRFDDDFLMPSTLPSAWLQVQANGRLLRFVDSRFDPAATPALISQVFPQARHIEPAAMSLRSIFVALARSGKNA